MVPKKRGRDPVPVAVDDLPSGVDDRAPGCRPTGHSRRIASASSGVSVLTLPLPRLTPLRDAAPAWTSDVVDPHLGEDLRIADQEPLPISAMAISEPRR